MAVRLLLVALLVVDAVLLALIELFYLPLRLGPQYGGVPLPLTILLAALTTPLLVHCASQLTPRLAGASAPLVAWVLAMLVFGLFGPGGDVLLPTNLRSVLLLAAGMLPAGVVLGRRLGTSGGASVGASGSSGAPGVPGTGASAEHSPARRDGQIVRP